MAIVAQKPQRLASTHVLPLSLAHVTQFTASTSNAKPADPGLIFSDK